MSAGRTLVAIKVKSGRAPEMLPGMAAFSEAFRPARKLADGRRSAPRPAAWRRAAAGGDSMLTVDPNRANSTMTSNNLHIPSLVRRLAREGTDTHGTVTLRTSIGRSNRSVASVAAVLSQSDYHRAIQAPKMKAPVVMRGDLEGTRQRWRPPNPSIEDVIANDEAQGEGEPAVLRRPRRRAGTFLSSVRPQIGATCCCRHWVSGGAQGGECSTLLEAAR